MGHKSQDNPARRWTELLFLAYSPVWMAIVALVMVSGALRTWGDGRHLLLGLGLAVPLWGSPFLLPAAADRGVPYGQRYIVKALVFITLLSFLQNYFGAVLFFRSFGMQYHFRVTWILNGTPVFLYPMTVAYFATYFTVMQIALRAFHRRFPRAPRVAQVCFRAGLSYATAFAETFFMANDLLSAYFSYADRRWTLLYGSVGYGTLFFLALPLFARIDRDERTPLSRVVWEVLGVNTLIMVCYEGYLRLWR